MKEAKPRVLLCEFGCGCKLYGNRKNTPSEFWMHDHNCRLRAQWELLFQAAKAIAGRAVKRGNQPRKATLLRDELRRAVGRCESIGGIGHCGGRCYANEGAAQAADDAPQEFALPAPLQQIDAAQASAPGIAGIRLGVTT
ncbi:MAG: hypothetical protein LC136_09135 [Burkholderiales bacterium]|nr:hypothetical protein [Burkholderiales bacterium]